jgi:hypothetical protein
VLDLPETLEDITVWKLEHAQVKRYLHYVQNKHPGSWPEQYMDAHALVVNWLVRIRPLGVVTSVKVLVGEHNYPVVSVAGIQICTVTHLEYATIVGETHARN